MKRFLAILLIPVLLLLCLSSHPAQAEEMLPALRIQVTYENLTPDGQADARIVVYHVAGSGLYEQSRMENLRLRFEGRNGIEVSQEEMSLGSPDTAQILTVHLTYKDPGPSVHPTTNEDRPQLRVHATTLNCGSADYTGVFDARARGRAFILYRTKNKDDSSVPYADIIERSAKLIASNFGNSYSQYEPVEVQSLPNPYSFYSMDGLGAAVHCGADENDITYIYLSTHGNYVGHEMHGNGDISFQDSANDKDAVSVAEIVRQVQQIPGRVVLLLDSCFSGAVVEESENLGFSGSRHFSASSTTSRYSSPAAVGPGLRDYEQTKDEAWMRTFKLIFDQLVLDSDDNPALELLDITADSMVETWAEYNVLCNVLDLVYDDAVKDGHKTCQDLKGKATAYYLMHGAVSEIVQHIFRMSSELTHVSDAVRMIDDLVPDEDKGTLMNIIKQLYINPFNLSKPQTTGDGTLPLFVTDQTYDDGYHRLVLLTEHVEISHPRILEITVLDDETGEGIPDAWVLLTDEDGYESVNQTGPDGVLRRTRTDRAIPLKIEDPEYREFTCTLGNDEILAERTAQTDDPEKAKEIAATIETRDRFEVRLTPDISRFYEYLNTQVVPGTGVVTSQTVQNKAYHLADTLASRCTGLISAAVCDLNGDRHSEMVTVTGVPLSGQNRKYGYQLTLYGLNRETGAVEQWDTTGPVVWVETETGSGTLSVHLQKSEGVCYLLCDANISNYTSSEWDYRTHRVYTVDGKAFTDITDFEAQLRGNSGIALHDAHKTETVLCEANLEWKTSVTTDHTSLQPYLQQPESARRFRPVVLNLQDYVTEQQVSQGNVDRLIRELEEQGFVLVHLSVSDQENNQKQYRYRSDKDCDLYVTIDAQSGQILSVFLSDARLYTNINYLKKRNQYLALDMTDELKALYHAILRSQALALTDSVVHGLESVPLTGNEKSNLDRINFYNRRTEVIGGIELFIEKGVFTAAAGSNTSFIRLTLPPDAAAPVQPDPTAIPEATAPQPELPVPAETPSVTASVSAFPQLVFTTAAFQREQKLAVYAAPSTKALRGAKGKAYVSTNGAVQVAGSDGDFLLVMYETSKGSVRVGYVSTKKIKGTVPQAGVLAFASEKAALTQAVALTDDPARNATSLGKLKKGTEVTILAEYQNYYYIESKLSGKAVRGFIPMEAVQ